MKGLYQELLLDHYKHPRNAGEIAHPSFTSQQYNPSCGDLAVITGLVQDDVLVEVKCKATGCVITVAAASMLTELILAQPLSSVASFDKELLLAKIGIPLGPVRIKCALLPLYALKEGISSYTQQT